MAGEEGNRATGKTRAGTYIGLNLESGTSKGSVIALLVDASMLKLREK